MTMMGVGNLFYPAVKTTSGAINTLNAPSETLECVGEVVLEEGASGGSKTISPGGGGSIGWRTTTGVVFANAGTNLRVGIQDVSLSYPAQGDGTWDVYADLVGGTDTIASSTWYNTAMETGAKTIAHGDLVSVSIEMTARGGSDSVSVFSANSPYTDAAGSPTYSARPSVSLNTATTSSRVPCLVLNFDDGTKGWLMLSNVMALWGLQAFNVGTAGSDEYGNFFEVPTACRVLGAYLAADGVSAAMDYEVILYRDALGSTPVVVDTVLVDTSQTIDFASRPLVAVFPNQPTVKPGENLVVAIRPTLTGNVELQYSTVDAAGDWLPTGVPASDCYGVSRLNNTGAFANTGSPAKTTRYGISLIIDQIDVSKGRASFNLGI